MTTAFAVRDDAAFCPLDIRDAVDSDDEADRDRDADIDPNHRSDVVVRAAVQFVP